MQAVRHRSVLPTAAVGATAAAADDDDRRGAAWRNSKLHGATAARTSPAPVFPPGPPGDPNGDWLDRVEFLVPWVILFIAALTRFYRLDQPSGVVFDEYHFGRFTNQYNDRQYLFDIHPPMGKLVFYWVSRLVGYDHTVCKYSSISEAYKPECKFIFIRATSAFFGALTPVVFYWICRNWGSSVRGGIVAALLHNFDILAMIESRCILIDSQLMFWISAALLTAQVWWRRHNEHSEAETEWESTHGFPVSEATNEELATDPRLMPPRERWGWVVTCGVVFANAIAVKWTGLATPGMIALESFMAVFFLHKAVPFWDLLRVAGVAFVVYASYFWQHFKIGIKTADGDGFMPLAFQKTIIGNGNYDPNAKRPPFLEMFFYLNAEMLRANARIDQRHHWESWWYEWMLNLRGLLYYSSDKGHGYTGSIYLIGNPFVIWLVFGFIVFNIVASIAYMRLRQEPGLYLQVFNNHFARIMYCIIVYWLNLLPYIAIKRSTFIYHYMPALMYGEIGAALMLDKLAGPRFMPRVTKLVLLLVIGCWVFYAPWIYALPMSAEGHARRRWLKRWD